MGAALVDAGYTAFCPTMQRVSVRRSGCRQSWAVASIPGYLFVAEVVPWDVIRSAEINGRRLMFSALGSGDIPSPIPDSSIEAIKKFDGCPVAPKELQVGDIVRVRFGPHDIRQLTVSAVDHDRIHVAMLILGGMKDVSVDRSRVEAA